ncbi:TetR family transcriptional regulator [Streptomyces sp. 3MP-14]|uniref:TetR family transcriptional regulator n=1 Tax=Streptomyces mimosae TaxID=2586635 RepID=A0A5N6A0W5_9ACTN|nr:MULTISPECIES: helix-turn-helix domain-containing protein [Streptomyces]KAB8161703.1 TetR family transcriptional regulator [Streptomyces mimosae]KAB8175029.1 TetR family transcriptional regulator [Streptomyces sp. 3MP-14]
MRVRESADGREAGGTSGVAANGRWSERRRSAPLRVDAQRNLRHVLSAARAVFGEQGYGAPMEEVARRARVGVGTVYRRFPNKEALVRYIAAEETQRLTERAREALAVEDEPWRALAGFVQRSAAAGAGRLLPPELLTAGGTRGDRVPSQRNMPAGGRTGAAGGSPVMRDVVEPVDAGARAASRAPGADAGSSEAGAPGAPPVAAVPAESGELLAAVEQLVERTRAAGQLRADVTVADLLLVIATTPPRLDDPTRQTAAEARLLEILLQGLRPGGR